MITDLLLKACRLLGRPNRIRHIREHFRLHRVCVKQRNAGLNELEIREHAAVLRSFPRNLFLDPIPACNLKCPICPTTTGWSNLRPDLLTPDVFKRITARLPLGYFERVALYNWGEPLINRHLTSYIRFFRENGIFTGIHSNMSLREFEDEFLEDLVGSGLDELCASVDGASQESYSQYRRGGDFSRVIRNLKRLSAAKKRLGSDTPRVFYKMLLNRFNEHEVEQARALAAECGVEFLLDEHFGFPEEERDMWIAESMKQKYGDTPVTSVSMTGGGGIHTECRQMWDSFIVNANGDVFPCCLICRSEWRVGNILDQTFGEIWNGERMRTLRRYAVDPDAAPPDFENHCRECANRYCKHKEFLGK